MEKIDREITDWIAQATGDAVLAAQIDCMTVVKRDYMRTGYFVYFAVPDDVAATDIAVRPVCPDISSAELLHGAGTTLFLRNGKVHYLEIYAKGGFFPENIQNFELIEPE